MEVRVRKPDEAELERLGVRSWPIWEKEASEFPWRYEEPETCYFLEGRVKVHLPDGSVVEIEKGDLAEFPAGLSCRWEIVEPVRKHYRLG